MIQESTQQKKHIPWLLFVQIALAVIVVSLSILWYAPSFGYAQVTPNQPVDCGTTNFSNLEAGQGFIFEGVSPGCYSAGFCGQCDVLLVIKNVVEAGFGLIGAFATLMLVIAGFLYLISRGNDRTVQQAKGIIASTITGLVISFLAWTIVGTVAVLVSGDPNATIASIQCSDVPAVSTCTLVSNVGDLPQGVFGGGVSGAGPQGGKILACDKDVIEGQYTRLGVDIGRLFNEIEKETGIDAVFMLAIYNRETGLGSNVKESSTGAYGILQIQPSTAAAYWSETVKASHPECVNKRSDTSRAFDGTDDGWCRHKPSTGKDSDNDPNCGAIASGRSVIEHFPNSCKAYIDTTEGFREYMRMFAKVLAAKQAAAKRAGDNSFEGIALRYAGSNKNGYVEHVQAGHVELCKQQGGTVYDRATPSGSRGGSLASGNYNGKYFGQIDAHISVNPRDTSKITHVVLHDGSPSEFTSSFGIGGMLNYWLTSAAGRENKISSHYAIERDGTIYQLADERHIANHAGGFNSKSIGIDLMKEHAGDVKPPNWTPQQYAAVRTLIGDIAGRTAVTVDDQHILGHWQVSRPGRRSDPREFNWEQIGLSSAGHSQRLPEFR